MCPFVALLNATSQAACTGASCPSGSTTRRGPVRYWLAQVKDRKAADTFSIGKQEAVETSMKVRNRPIDQQAG